MAAAPTIPRLRREGYTRAPRERTQLITTPTPAWARARGGGFTRLPPQPRIMVKAPTPDWARIRGEVYTPTPEWLRRRQLDVKETLPPLSEEEQAYMDQLGNVRGGAENPFAETSWGGKQRQKYYSSPNDQPTRIGLSTWPYMPSEIADLHEGIAKLKALFGYSRGNPLDRLAEVGYQGQSGGGPRPLYPLSAPIDTPTGPKHLEGEMWVNAKGEPTTAPTILDFTRAAVQRAEKVTSPGQIHNAEMLKDLLRHGRGGN